MGLAAEADGAAAQPELTIERQLGVISGLAERFKGVEAYANGLGAEAKFVLGVGIAGGKQAAGGMPRGRHVAIGGDQEVAGENE